MTFLGAIPVQITREPIRLDASVVSPVDALSQHIEIGCPCLFHTSLHACMDCSAESSACCKGRLHSAMLYFIELFEQSALSNSPRKLEYILNRTAQIERQRDVAAAFRYLFHQIQSLH